MREPPPAVSQVSTLFDRSASVCFRAPRRQPIRNGTTHRRWFARERLTPQWADPPLLYVRWLLGVGVAAVAGAAGFLFMLLGTVTTSGCFFGCTDPNYLVGIPALIGAGTLAAAFLGALWWGFADRDWRRVGPILAWTAAAATLILIMTSMTIR